MMMDGTDVLRYQQLRKLVSAFRQTGDDCLADCRDDMRTEDRYDKTARAETFYACAYQLEKALDA